MVKCSQKDGKQLTVATCYVHKYNLYNKYNYVKYRIVKMDTIKRV